MDKRASAKALQWQLLGFFALLMTIAALYYLSVVRDVHTYNSTINITGFTLAALCFHHARRYSARADLDARQGRLVIEDSPVVYLRPFKVDDSSNASISHVASETEEEMLTSLFAEIGPFIALGKPHEELPTLGASRFYVENGEWEEAVADLISRARLAVFRTGETEGLLWEMRQAVATLPPERLLLLVTYGKEGYEVFRKKAQQFFPRPLPDHPPGRFFLSRLRGAIMFEADWTARFLPFKPFKVNFLRGSFGDPSRVWRMGLRPLYERLGVPWKPPSINWLRVAFIAFFLTIVLLSVLE